MIVLDVGLLASLGLVLERWRWGRFLRANRVGMPQACSRRSIHFNRLLRVRRILRREPSR